MKTLEATMRELVAENKAALEKALAENRIEFQRLQVAVERHGRLQMACMAIMAGIVAAAVGVIFTVWSG